MTAIRTVYAAQQPLNTIWLELSKAEIELLLHQFAALAVRHTIQLEMNCFQNIYTALYGLLIHGLGIHFESVQSESLSK